MLCYFGHISHISVCGCWGHDTWDILDGESSFHSSLENPAKALQQTSVHLWGHTHLWHHKPKLDLHGANSCPPVSMLEGEISERQLWCQRLDDWGVCWYSRGPSAQEPCVLSHVSGLNLAPRWIPVPSQTPQSSPLDTSLRQSDTCEVCWAGDWRRGQMSYVLTVIWFLWSASELIKQLLSVMKQT